MAAGRPAAGGRGLKRSWLLAVALALAACSRSGSLTGQVVASASREQGNPAAHISVMAVPDTDAFERDWAAAVDGFQQEMRPARSVQAAADTAMEQARWAWDQNLTGPRSPRIRSRERALRAAEARLVQATRQVELVAQRHEREAVALLERHAVLQAQTDEDGRYVLAGLPTGPVYVYAGLTAGGR